MVANRTNLRTMSWGVYRCLMVAGLFYIMMLEPGIVKSYSVIIKDMRKDVDISMSYYGLILGISHGIPCLLGFVNIPLLRRFSYRQVIMTGSVIAGISFTAISFANSATYLTLCYIGAGLGNIFIYMPVHACPSTYFPDDFEIVSGILSAGSGVGIIVIPVLIEFLNQVYGWRGAALLLGAFALNMAIGGAYFGPVKPNTTSPSRENDAHSDDSKTDHGLPLEDGETDHLLSVPGPSHSPALCTTDHADQGQGQKDNVFKNIVSFFDLYVLYDHPVVLAGFVLYVIFFVVYGSWLLFVIPNAEAKGVASHTAVYIAVVGGITSTFGRIGIGLFSSLKIAGNDLIICVLNALSGLAFICNLKATELWSLYLLAGVNGFCLGAFITVTIIYIKDLVPLERFKSAICLATFLPGIAEPIGSALLGYIYDVTASFNLSYVIVGGLHLLAIPIALIPRMLNRVQSARSF